MIAIACMDETGGIGKNRTLPWEKDSEDLKWFKQITFGGTVIMGRNTYEDDVMPKPLPNRLNVVIGRTKAVDYDYDTSLTLFFDKFDHQLFEYFRKPILIGGASLFYQAIKEELIDTFYINVKAGDYGCDREIDLALLNKHYAPVKSRWSWVHEELEYYETSQVIGINEFRRKSQI